MSLQGHCLCRSVKIAILEEAFPLKPVFCHCSNCQAVSSATGTIIMLLDEKEVKIEGHVATYHDGDTTRKTTISRTFCPKCGTAVATYAPLAPGKAIVKYGLFAQEQTGKYIAPIMELYCKDRNSWESPVPNSIQEHAMFSKENEAIFDV